MKRVQAFGAGVQSVTLLRMVLAGEVEPVDRVIFADTQAEPQHFYEVVERERALCLKAGIPFDVVTYRDLGSVDPKSVHVPLFTTATEDAVVTKVTYTGPGFAQEHGMILEHPEDFEQKRGWWARGTPTKKGDKGMLFRTCTDRFKVQPIRQKIRKLGWDKEGVELYMGISTDEIQRCKPSRVGYITNRFPLIEKDMRRSDCHAYLMRLGVTAAKSACYFCPYRSAAGWRSVKENPNDWWAAVQYDRSIRNVRPGHECFVHVSRTPLETAVMDDEPSLFDAECEGYCGL